MIDVRFAISYVLENESTAPCQSVGSFHKLFTVPVHTCYRLPYFCATAVYGSQAKALLLEG